MTLMVIKRSKFPSEQSEGRGVRNTIPVYEKKMYLQLDQRLEGYVHNLCRKSVCFLLATWLSNKGWAVIQMLEDSELSPINCPVWESLGTAEPAGRLS